MRNITAGSIMNIKYKSGYKYQLVEDYSIACSIPGTYKISRYVLLENGVLTVYSGYAWDGASGPTIDTENSMRASLVHDALYQLMREGNLAKSYRIVADEMLHSLLLEDGMSWIRAWYWYRGVRMFGGNFS